MRSVNSTVEWLGPDEQDPSSVVVKVALVPGLANTNLKIGRDQLEVFLAIIGVASERDLAGQSVRITVDDEAGTEQIAFPRPLASVADPAAVDPAAEEGLLVIADSKPADEVTVYDNVAQRVAMPVGEPDDGGDTVAALTRADAASEERARARIAAAATAPVGRRYFLYRETYGEAARGTTIELTPDEFALLGGPDAYLHVEDCGVIDSQTLSSEAAKDIERLLARATSRPDAELTRAELERLTAEGRVVSCAVY